MRPKSEIQLELDEDNIKSLKKIADLADTSVDTVVNVILAWYVVTGKDGETHEKV